jgi:uncharacterized membrane protein
MQRIIFLVLIVILIFVICFSIYKIISAKKNHNDTLFEIERLQTLKNDGIITEEEFQKAKEKLLKKI